MMRTELSRRFVTVAASALALGSVVLAPQASKLITILGLVAGRRRTGRCQVMSGAD